MGCRTARPGTRCKGSEFAEHGNRVLVCKKGKLVRWQTRPVVAAFLTKNQAGEAEARLG
ncbi:MAG TPA: hypothetical protein VJM33_06080 [Microthrixaceae bacterium]|nr:hypothetical protein [Microthrixaceae bacterium]